ncbi:MAG: protein kinase, partial [Clostridia bacterium]|nr:protein kinase [Clostridia bacterium]
IHRDIKPENIFVNDLGNYKLGDFGIARKLENKTAGLSQKGTFNYMAPEVSKNMTYDATIDLYSLGIVLYRLMNRNRLPFYDLNKQLLSHSEREQAVNRRMQGEQLPPPCDASPALAEVILRACAYNPQDRYASATAMKEALIMVQNGSYQQEPDLDGTIAVRRTKDGANGGDAGAGVDVGSDWVMKDTGSASEVKVDTFGPEKKGGGKSKRTLILAIIAAVLSVCILFGAITIGVAVAIFKSFTGGSDSTVDEEPSYVESYVESYSASTPVQEYIPDYSNAYLSGAAASSYLNEAKANIQHTPNRIADGKMDTGWVEGVAGYGENQYVQLQFDRECYVSGFTIWNGYHKSQDLYAKNSRPARIQITFSDGSHYYSNLSDVMQPQKITFSQKIATKEVTITVVSVYHGSKFDDTVISEISLF